LIFSINSVFYNSDLLEISYVFFFFFSLFIFLQRTDFFSRKETFPLNEGSLLNRFYKLCDFAGLCGNSICCKWAGTVGILIPTRLAAATCFIAPIILATSTQGGLQGTEMRVSLLGARWMQTSVQHHSNSKIRERVVGRARTSI
jgi:hypothetical protein